MRKREPHLGDEIVVGLENLQVFEHVDLIDLLKLVLVEVCSDHFEESVAIDALDGHDTIDGLLFGEIQVCVVLVKLTFHLRLGEFCFLH